MIKLGARVLITPLSWTTSIARSRGVGYCSVLSVGLLSFFSYLISFVAIQRSFGWWVCPVFGKLTRFDTLHQTQIVWGSPGWWSFSMFRHIGFFFWYFVPSHLGMPRTVSSRVSTRWSCPSCPKILRTVNLVPCFDMLGFYYFKLSTIGREHFKLACI